MTKENLKTLKDLKVIYSDSAYPKKGVITEELRAEAIKWVKKKGHYGLCLQDWEDFFNLTEEDLK